MKNRLYMLVICLILASYLLFGCGRTNKEQSPSETKPMAESELSDAGAMAESELSDTDAMAESGPLQADTVPDISRVKSICELSTLKCYYHNVAKSTKKAGTGLVHAFEKERDFWIAYTGIVEISYRTEQVKMRQDGKHITITLPEPVVTCSVDPDSWNEQSQISAKDQWLQKNPITGADVTNAMRTAQENMEADVRSNTSLLATAELQAKGLIENYINRIGQATGVSYRITWEEPEKDVKTEENNS